MLGAVVVSLLGQPSMPAIEAGAAPVTFAEAPKRVMFDTPAQVKRQAPQIMAQAVKTHTLPLGNVTEITDEERSALGSSIAGGSKLN